MSRGSQNNNLASHSSSHFICFPVLFSFVYVFLLILLEHTSYQLLSNSGENKAHVCMYVSVRVVSVIFFRDNRASDSQDARKLLPQGNATRAR